MDIREALDVLKPMLADRSILKIFHNVKYDLGILDRYGIEVPSIDDTLLLSYVARWPAVQHHGRARPTTGSATPASRSRT